VHALDPRVEGVHAPQWLMKQPQLVLQIGLDMPVAIPDLRVDDDGIYGTLSFSRTPFTCVVPWAAVFALVGDDGRGLVWPESFPLEIAQEVQREAARAGIDITTDEVLERPRARPAARRARAVKRAEGNESSKPPRQRTTLRAAPDVERDAEPAAKPSRPDPIERAPASPGLQLIQGGGEQPARPRAHKAPPRSRHLRLIKR